MSARRDSGPSPGGTSSCAVSAVSDVSTHRATERGRDRVGHRSALSGARRRQGGSHAELRRADVTIERGQRETRGRTTRGRMVRRQAGPGAGIKQTPWRASEEREVTWHGRAEG